MLAGVQSTSDGARPAGDTARIDCTVNHSLTIDTSVAVVGSTWTATADAATAANADANDAGRIEPIEAAVPPAIVGWRRRSRGGRAARNAAGSSIGIVEAAADVVGRMARQVEETERVSA